MPKRKIYPLARAMVGHVARSTLTSLDLPPRVSIAVKRRPATAWFEMVAVRADEAATRAARVNMIA